VKLKVLFCLTVAVLLVSGAELSQATKLYPAGGLLFVDPLTVPGFKILAPSNDPTAALPPPSTDFSSEMPPVGAQGAQNSCVAWAAGYYDQTHMEWVERWPRGDTSWHLTDPKHQISPSFIYNQINAGRDAGASMMDAQILLCDQGACMMPDFPYNQYDYYSWPGESAFARAITYRDLDSWGINMMEDPGVLQVKYVLAAHHSCVLGINVYANFDNIQNYDNIYTVHDKSGRSRGGHALCLVGYDDNKQTADGPGAFKFVNSWGTDWGDAGYGWMSYYAVHEYKAGLSQGWVYYTNDRDRYVPQALARVKLTHPCRDRIGITFGAGTPAAPLAVYTFRRFWALQGQITDRPFPANNLVFDMTDGISYFDQTDYAFVSCIDNKKDRKTGSIDFLSIEYGTRHGSTMQKVTIPDYGVAAYSTVGFPRAFGPQGTTIDGSVAAGRASYRNGAANLAFNLDRPGSVNVAFFDGLGRTVARATTQGTSGANEVSVSLPRSAGVYFYRLESGHTTMTGKLAAIR